MVDTEGFVLMARVHSAKVMIINTTGGICPYTPDGNVRVIQLP
jgi:hypothetical protein